MYCVVNKQQMWVKKVVYATEEQGSSICSMSCEKGFIGKLFTGHGAKVMLK